jgi:hypothetical protein
LRTLYLLIAQGASVLFGLDIPDDSLRIVFRVQHYSKRFLGTERTDGASLQLGYPSQESVQGHSRVGGPDMNVHVLTAGAIRVMLFTGSVLALMHGASIVLRTQASWIAMAIFIGLAALLAALAVCAWMLRRLWRSGPWRRVNDRQIFRHIVPASSVETGCHLLTSDTKKRNRLNSAPSTKDCSI